MIIVVKLKIDLTGIVRKTMSKSFHLIILNIEGVMSLLTAY